MRTCHFGLTGPIAAALAGAPAAAWAAADARALTDEGHVLTVGSWAYETMDGGVRMRVPASNQLGWELRDGSGSVIAAGEVPGTVGGGLDGSPSLSRSPATTEVWLAWSTEPSAGEAREIRVQRFAPQGWVADSTLVVASDVDDQLEPVLVHDESGTAWIAWIDGVYERSVRFAGISADGRVLGSRNLSDGASVRNGPPNLGLDATGRLFVAYAGSPAEGGEPRLYVHAAAAWTGGYSHIPDPIIELGLRTTVPAPTIERVVSGIHLVPSRVNLTVLGGTPVAWWTERAPDGAERFRYVAAGEAGWQQADLRTIELSGSHVPTTADALALVESRLRRVINQSPGFAAPGLPSLPGHLVRTPIRR